MFNCDIFKSYKQLTSALPGDVLSAVQENITENHGCLRNVPSLHGGHANPPCTHFSLCAAGGSGPGYVKHYCKTVLSLRSGNPGEFRGGYGRLRSRKLCFMALVRLAGNTLGSPGGT